MNNTLSLFKLLADDTRLKILQALHEKEMYVELLAERLQLSAPTVSFHMKKLLAAGLVDARREQYYTIYSIRQSAFEYTLASLLFQTGEEHSAEEMREEMYRRRVLKSFMPDGHCQTMPAQVKKRLIIYEEIYSRFDPSRTYTEKEVNEVIRQVYDDFCTVRRTMIALGWMSRENGIYTLHPPVEPVDLARLRL